MTCPTCGSPVRVVSSDEGTSHYAPDPAPLDVERLARAMSKVAYPDPEDAWPNTVKDVKDLYRHQARAIAREYAKEQQP